MNKTLLIQQIYPGMTYLPLLVKTFERNAVYCEKNNIDYWTILSEELDVANGGWDKVLHVQRGLEKYDLVIWLDADAVIFDLSRDLKNVPIPTDTIGVVRFNLPTQHYNVGVLYFRNGERVKKFVSDWIGQYPGQGAWRDQEIFNKMKNDVVVSLPVEWNRNYDMNPNANPVVMGFHGFGVAEKRLELMTKVLC